LLEVENLSVHFSAQRLWRRNTAPSIKAVDEVSFSVAPREIVGLVGESGSGKSTLARAILRLIGATSGSVKFEGRELLGLGADELKSVRRRMQVIFQDPYASLNPRMTAGQNVAEGLLLQNVAPAQERDRAVRDLLEQVGLPAAAATCYPHEFSGGQRQRIGIARALAVQPIFIVADEPVSALDMSIQAQILNLLLDQQEQRDLALLFIGHDLSVIRHFCDRIIVLYLGRVMEMGLTEEVFAHPRHPYTRALIEAAPAAHPARRRDRVALAGDPPSNSHSHSGCVFSLRCPWVIDACRVAVPPPREVAAEHFSACIRDV
jgi:oligopeptide/dipeptide ABC transporter ATP-binding protein